MAWLALSSHADSRKRTRLRGNLLPNLSILVPEPPLSKRYPIRRNNRMEIRMTSTAFLVCAKNPTLGGQYPWRSAERTVITVLDLPDTMLASVFVKLIFGLWVEDDSDGFMEADKVRNPDQDFKMKTLRLKRRRR